MRKTITVLVYGGNRTLWADGSLTLTIRDFLRGRTLVRQKLTGATAEVQLAVPFDSGEVYPVTVAAPRHRDAWYLIDRGDFLRTSGTERFERDDTIVRLLLVPKPSSSIDLDDGWRALQRLGSPTIGPRGLSSSDYVGLASTEKMALLNIEAKLRATYLGGAPLVSYVRGIRRVLSDRVFLYLAAPAKELMRRSADFGSAAGHDAPEAVSSLGAHPDSWKHQQFVEGNMQVSFAKEPESVGAPGGPTELCYSADVDINLGRGVSHAAEWIRNNVLDPGHKTEQDVVFGLLSGQGILPAYTLQPSAPATARAGAPMRRARVRRKAATVRKTGVRPVSKSTRRPHRARKSSR